MHNGCYIKLRSIMPVTKQSGKMEKNHNFKTCCSLTVYIYIFQFLVLMELVPLLHSFSVVLTKCLPPVHFWKTCKEYMSVFYFLLQDDILVCINIM